jgi:uncharacterized protein YjiS (DUF1127 family)
MSSYAYTAEPKTQALGYAFRTSVDRGRDGVAFVRAYLTEWRRRVRARNELITLSDRDLRDIRWTRAEVEAEARKPFWRV